MRSNDVAISVRNLTKRYRIFGHPGDRIKQVLSLGQIKFHREFTALQDVSFDIKQGETVGIVGRNGSGKSTLLQLICGILKPTHGSVEVDGRIAALLELGAGFNPEFTGRENVYFQGALMGFTQAEMQQRFDEIAEFADIGDFIDQPVRTYSSGMYVRLAFSVSVAVNPQVLIVDEALSVGDMAFQHKSRKRMLDLKAKGKALVVVSHDRATVSALCDRCILLDHGSVLFEGKPSDVFDYYHALVATADSRQIATRTVLPGRTQVVSGTGEAVVESIRLLNSRQEDITLFDVGEQVTVEFVVHVDKPIPRLVLGFTIRDAQGGMIFGTNTNNFNRSLNNPVVGQPFVFQFSFVATMGVGTYSISTALVSTDDRFTNNYECRELAHFFEVTNSKRQHFGGSVWLNPRLTVQAGASQ